MKSIHNIGVFDSGVGGLSVVSHIVRELHLDRIVYYCDNARLPYGSRDSKDIISFSLEALDFFDKFDLDLLIVACNTVSVHALDSMKRQSRIPIIGMVEPSILSLSSRAPAVRSNVLLAATSATISSNVYQTELANRGYTSVSYVGANLLVNLVEERIYDGRFVIAALEHYFFGIRPNVVLLCCTHFPLLLDSFRRYFGAHCSFVHAGESTVDYIKSSFNCDLSDVGMDPLVRRIEYYASGDVSPLKRAASILL